MSSVRVEFTVEPFVDGQPGTHVQAAWDAVANAGYVLDNGPFSALVDAPAGDVGKVVQLIVAAAYAAGATRVSLVTEVIEG